MRALMAVLAAVATPLVVAAPAEATTPPACTCAAFPIVADSVGRASVAFVGTPLTSEETDGGELGTATMWRVQVDVAIKGEVANVVQVYTDETSAQCGIALHLAVPAGFIPQVASGGRLRVGECGDVVQPSDLTALEDEALPDPEGSGPIAGLVAARAGPAALIAVDSRFVPVGYVALEGDPVAAAPCASGAVVSVLATSRSATTVTQIRLATLEVISTATISADPAAVAQRGAAEVFCTSDEGGSAVVLRTVDGATLWSLSATGETLQTELPGAIDAAPGALGVHVLTPDALSLLSLDGTPVSVLATFLPDAAALSMILDGWDLVVAVSNDVVGGRFIADELRRYSLLDASTSAVRLAEPVPAPALRGAPGSMVIASAYGGETWLGRDGQAIAAGTPNVWPAGDGWASWNEGTRGATAHFGSEEVGALEFASNPTFVLAIDGGPTLDSESPAAQAMPMVPTPGRILTPSTIATVAPSTTTESTTAPSTTTATTVADTTESDDDSDLGTSAMFGAAIVAGVALVLIAAAIALRRRQHPVTDPPPPTLR